MMMMEEHTTQSRYCSKGLIPLLPSSYDLNHFLQLYIQVLVLPFCFKAEHTISIVSWINLTYHLEGYLERQSSDIHNKIQFISSLPIYEQKIFTKTVFLSAHVCLFLYANTQFVNEHNRLIHNYAKNKVEIASSIVYTQDECRDFISFVEFGNKNDYL